MSFWDVVWFIVISFAFVMYLMTLWWILADLFQDSGTSGWVKAIWVVALLVLPFLTALIYLIARGPKMAERAAQRAETQRLRQDVHIRDVAGRSPSPVEQITQAQALLDAQVISPDEFDRLKAKALAGVSDGAGVRQVN